MSLGRNAFNERALSEYYEIVKKFGPEAADQIYDVYKAAGRFEDGISAADRLTDLIKSKPVAKAGQYLDEAAAPIAAGIQTLADKIPLGKGGATATRMAGQLPGKIIAKALPVLGAVGAVTDVADILTNDTSFGNKVMDTTAMGIGGTIGAVVGLGNPFIAAGGASLGKMGSDALQWLFGDKKTPQQRKLEEQLALLGGRI
jgi:hypothetical protein